MPEITLTQMDRKLEELEMLHYDLELEIEDLEEKRKRELRRQQREHERSIERQKSILRRPKVLKKK